MKPDKDKKQDQESSASEAPISMLVVLEDGIVMALPVSTHDIDVTHPILGNVLQRIEKFNLPQGAYAQERRDLNSPWTATGLTTRSDGPVTPEGGSNYDHSINFGGNTDLRIIRVGN